MIYIGTSGFQYPHWNNGVFYPPGTKDHFGYYSQLFNTVEINASFYRTPTSETIESWGARLPDSAKLILKTPRSVSHTRRLKLFSALATNGIDLLSYFVDGIKLVPKHKVGPVLLQVHPRMKIHLDRLEDVLGFFHDNDLQVAFEARNDTWFTHDLFMLLEKFKSALVISDWKDCQTEFVDTANFAYIRRHGPHQYSGNYSSEDLANDAFMIREIQFKGRDVFVFFNNDGDGAAPKDALRLAEIVKNFMI